MDFRSGQSVAWPSGVGGKGNSGVQELLEIHMEQFVM